MNDQELLDIGKDLSNKFPVRGQQIVDAADLWKTERARRMDSVNMVRTLLHNHWQESMDGTIRCQCVWCKAAHRFLEEADKWK